MRLEVTYRVSRIARVGCFCCVRCSLFQAENCSVVLLSPLPSPLSLVDLVSIGLVSVSTDLVSVAVPGGLLPLGELLWMPACPARGLWLKACCSPWNHRTLWQAPSPSSSIGDEFNILVWYYLLRLGVALHSNSIHLLSRE